MIRPYESPRSTLLPTTQRAPQGLQLPAEALILSLEFLLHGCGGLMFPRFALFSSLRTLSFLFGALPGEFPLLLRGQEPGALGGIPKS